LAHSEAKILHEKIHKKAYSDDEIIRILTTRSKAQLLATFNSYKDQFSHPINKVNNNTCLLYLGSSLNTFSKIILVGRYNTLNVCSLSMYFVLEVSCIYLELNGSSLSMYLVLEVSCIYLEKRSLTVL
jgi:hypothetical protein